MVQFLKTLWDFTRPHTIIGSFLSITTLYCITVQPLDWGQYQQVYWWTLLSALGCNLFITGLNQITDRDMDIINKPFLPLASGALTMRSAKRIVVVALLVCLVASVMSTMWMPAIMILILVIGTGYSLPPLRLKRHHISAALSIIVVRGVLVNLAIGAALDIHIHGSVLHWGSLMLLTIFVSLFSLAIAWFKDLYDTRGDDVYQIRTFPLLYSIRTTFIVGNILVLLAYLVGVGYSYWVIEQGEAGLLTWGHLVLTLLFAGHVVTSSVERPEDIYRFYMRFWVFFFAEYLLFMVAALTGW